MENDKRIMISLVLIAIIAVAAIGIGYAYTASTSNTNNTATTEYITVIQADVAGEGNGAYKFSDEDKVYWDAEDKKLATATTYSNGAKSADEIVTVFTLTPTANATFGPGTQKYTVVQVGNPFKVQFQQNGGNLKTDLTCAVSSTTFTKPTDGTSIFLEIVDDASSPNTTYMKLTDNNIFKAWNASASNWNGDASFSVPVKTSEYCEVTVKVFYGYETMTLPSVSGIAVSHGAGTPPSGPSETPVSSADLVFTVTVSGSN